MFDESSRYKDVENATLEMTQDGVTRTVVYKRRRFLPSPAAFTTLVEHTVRDGDRLDRVTAGYVGDPNQAWRVCDANQALHPDELTQEPGRRVKIAMPNR